jgi:LmbE family N-acetylglucosaminyl deacetylase
MNLGHERTGGIKHFEISAAGVITDFSRNTVGTHDDPGANWNLVKILDKNRALIAKIRDDMIVVHDLMAHVDRGAESLERALNDFDGTLHPGTKSSGLGQ